MYYNKTPVKPNITLKHFPCEKHYPKLYYILYKDWVYSLMEAVKQLNVLKQWLCKIFFHIIDHHRVHGEHII